MEIKQIVLAARPKGMPGKEAFRFETATLPSLQEDEVLLKPLYISVDPYLRGRMNDELSYIAPFELNKPIEGGAVAIVEESNSSLFKKGDKVAGFLPWATRMIAKAGNLQHIATDEFPDTYYVGILGSAGTSTGLTAYFCLTDILKPKAGETVVISGAAGAVGTAAGQIAKILGARVVGIAGSDEKVKLLKASFGYDEVINYKTADLNEAIAKACPKGVDAYFDNVGGPVTDAVIAHTNFFSRIAICGQIAGYNESTPSLMPNFLYRLVIRRILMQGFLILDYAPRFEEGLQHLKQWLREGKLRTTETIVEGFDQLPDAFLSLFSGYNTGKLIVKV